MILHMTDAAVDAEHGFGPWTFCAQPPDAIKHSNQLREVNADWLPALVPGTVASALRALGKWDLSQPLDADAHDWWYRTTFEFRADARQRICSLIFDGLATLADVWLNGQPIFSADNMFRAYCLDVTPLLQAHNELVIGFRSLTHYLSHNRPRPRWKTNLVSHQQMRWCRTSLLGRIPGWTPPVPPVGPWRYVRFEVAVVATSELHLATTVEGNTGKVMLGARIQSAAPIERASLIVGEIEAPLETQRSANGWSVAGTLHVPDAPLWWPHTHGAQPLFDARVEIAAGGEIHRVPVGKIGFRNVEIDRNAGFGVRVNDVPIFCRGACWTISDIATLDGTPESLAHDIGLARDAGVNMLRVGGTMIYESERFYELCDELGILVWQDFMFANMDYPIEDPAFAANLESEATQQLQRLAKHPSVAIYCGNSEVEQQAAMLGVPRELWRNRWFAERLPAICAEYHPGAEYVPSTPSGGTLPFHTRSGIAHYYGVGAYLRPLSDVRRADVKFTPECLGFSNVPETDTVNLVAAGGSVMTHHPRWKQRVPRDTGAGWDFEDVRDHYLKQMFGVDPVQLRSFDMDRYLCLSRVVTGELMAQVFAEWRSGHSRNRGGLVWFFKDLWPGAGWGIIDSLGLPKAAYYYLKRSWQNVQIALTDEGLDGLHLHVINETANPFRGFVELTLLKDDHVVIARRQMPCELAVRSQEMLESDALLGGFYDVAHAYRFGPPKHDVAIATLLDGDRRVVGEAFHFVQPREPALLAAVTLEAEAAPRTNGCYEVRLKTDRLLRSVCFDAKGFLSSDSYFHLVPGREKTVRFKPIVEAGAKFKAYVEALNLRDPVRIGVSKT